MLSDLLAELTEIDLNGSYAQKLPQSLCSSCTRKLISAYYFVKQARNANEVLMNHLLNGQTSAPPDCLQELPMELCAEQHVEIKMETKDDEVDNVITCSDLPELALFQQAEDLDILDEIKADSVRPMNDPLISPEALKQEHDTDASNTGLDANDFPSQDYECDDSLDDLPLKQRAHKWKQDKKPSGNKRYNCFECSRSFSRAVYLKQHCARTHKPKSDWFSCTLCVRKFSRSDALQAHLKVHRDPKRSANLNDRKRAKDIDLNLCKPHGYKLIECMICQTKFDKMSQLRQHMEDHPDIDNFDDQQKLNANDLAELLYPDLKNVTEEHLKTLIRKELASGAYQRFYSITSQCGYEMDLNSSETESEADLEAEELTMSHKTTQKSKYLCQLCQNRYPRKYQLYEHQRVSHSWSEAPHVCGRCDARFVSLQVLRHHNESQCKNAQKRFLCHKCPLRFRWKHNLKAHVRDHRITNQTFECNECKRVFDKKKSLTVHMLSVHVDESKLIPCQWCSRKFYRHDYLVKHLKRHGINEQDIPLAETLIDATSKPNGPKNISCKICNLQFEHIVDLRAHIQLELKLALSLHQNYKSLENYSITNDSGFELQLDDSETEDEGTTMPYKTPSLYVCELCQVQCRRKYEMIQHQRTMHRFDKMPYDCERCIFKCVSKNIMDYHKQVQCFSEEKKHVCNKCSFKFMWPENLEKHVQIQHGGWQQESLENTSQKPKSDMKSEASEVGVQLLQCPHCDRTYQMKSRLNNHIRDVHVNGDRKRKEAIKKFLCSLCGRETHSAASLVTHMRRHTGEKPFKCDLCEMAFPRHSEMVSHRRMHTGEKPFHCTVCGKDFARSDKLKRHMLTHSGLKPHKCTYCEKSYRQSKDLKLHLQQHTGECPFICATCGERFIQRSSLEKHRMMRRHFDEVDDRTTPAAK